MFAAQHDRMRAGRGVSLLAAAGVLVSVSSCSSDADERRGPTVAAGTYLAVSDAAKQTKHTVTVQLPWGSVEVSLGRPVARISGVAGRAEKPDAEYRDIVPPAGGRWLAVAVTAEPDQYDSGEYAFTSQPLPETRISVVTGRDVTLLARARDSAPADSDTATENVPRLLDRTGFLAVPDDSTDVRIRVDFDGERQEFGTGPGRRSLGRFGPYYRDVSESVDHSPCGESQIPGYTAYYDDSCEVRERTVPWLAGKGWAPAGRSWRIVTYSASPPTSFGPLGRPDPDDDTPFEVVDPGPEAVVLRYGTRAPNNTVASKTTEDASVALFDVGPTDVGGRYTVTIAFAAVDTRRASARIQAKIVFTIER